MKMLHFLFLSGSINLYGQIEVKYIDFEKLSQFDSVTVTAGSRKWIYQYQGGSLSKALTYDSGILDGYSLHERSNNYFTREDHSLRTSYPEDAKPLKYWDEIYRLDATVVEHGLVKEVSSYRVLDDSSWLNNKTSFRYDSQGRLVKEIFEDHWMGYRNIFKSNSTEFDSLEYKSEVEVKTTLYIHKSNRIIVEYVFKSKVMGTGVVTLTSFGKPSKITTTNYKGEKLDESTFKYDVKGRVIECRYESYGSTTIWDESGDTAAPLTEKIHYNNAGLPETVISTYDGWPPTIHSYRYYHVKKRP